MRRNTGTGPLGIILSVFLAIAITLAPLPGGWAVLRPAFLAATVVFWVLAQPDQFGVLSAWLAGLVLDVCYATPLGEHALALAITAYIMIRLRQFFAGLPLMSQTLLVLPVIGSYEFALFWIDGISGQRVELVWRWLPVISTAVIWPFWRFFLQRLMNETINA